jgi:hypothetical protein
MDTADRTALYYATNSRPWTKGRDDFAVLLMRNRADPMKTPEKYRSKFSVYPSVKARMNEQQALGAVLTRNNSEATELSWRDPLQRVDTVKTSASKKSFVIRFMSKSSSKNKAK